MNNKLVMAMKVWGSGMASTVVTVVCYISSWAFLNKYEIATGDLYHISLVLIVAPILAGLVNRWFWKDHDWGGSEIKH